MLEREQVLGTYFEITEKDINGESDKGDEEKKDVENVSEEVTESDGTKDGVNEMEVDLEKGGDNHEEKDDDKEDHNEKEESEDKEEDVEKYGQAKGKKM